jgi:hypothetical protein
VPEREVDHQQRRGECEHAVAECLHPALVQRPAPARRVFASGHGTISFTSVHGGNPCGDGSSDPATGPHAPSLPGRGPATGLILKFLEHFAAITQALVVHGLWDEADGLCCDRLLTPDGTAVPVRYRSMVGIIPMLTAGVVDEGMLTQALTVGKQFAGFLGQDGLDSDKLTEQGLVRGKPGDRQLLLSVAGTDRLEKLFTKLFDTSEFLSPYGLRVLSAYHGEHPLRARRGGVQRSAAMARSPPPATWSAALLRRPGHDTTTHRGVRYSQPHCRAAKRSADPERASTPGQPLSAGRHVRGRQPRVTNPRKEPRLTRGKPRCGAVRPGSPPPTPTRTNATTEHWSTPSPRDG